MLYAAIIGYGQFGILIALIVVVGYGVSRQRDRNK
jgi:hypothetical protein